MCRCDERISGHTVRCSAPCAGATLQVLCCEVEAIFTTLLEDGALTGALFALLEQPRPLDCMLAGYFARVLVCLLMRRSHQLLGYLKVGSLPRITPHLCCGCGCWSRLLQTPAATEVDEGRSCDALGVRCDRRSERCSPTLICADFARWVVFSGSVLAGTNMHTRNCERHPGAGG